MSNESEGEKDNFWLYIGGVIILTIGLVLLLKARETESVPYSAYAETKAQVEKQIQNAK
ncbi:LPXTG cell wall anchor domain-containing protein [Methylococcus sp. EFPC2]|uniref:LPXTG cell wall anchor domain-containing protein n=1 Tax=Methylococcus sp. EFPC2 TaxID=2812648 RepID=UPI0019672798|nr:LPXTG cell wall anchor domain-containing protein [Methylococcus sp. EFPC2]QSA98655.1 LPXTG cell wall anchor domain-containing protein [Methylococcus sp. EFPC2]